MHLRGFASSNLWFFRMLTPSSFKVSSMSRLLPYLFSFFYEGRKLYVCPPSIGCRTPFRSFRPLLSPLSLTQTDYRNYFSLLAFSFLFME